MNLIIQNSRLRILITISILLLFPIFNCNKVYSQIVNCGKVDYCHLRVFDQDFHLESWYKDSNGPFEHIVKMSAEWWKSVPKVNGWPSWCTSSIIDRQYNQSNGAIPGSVCSFAILSCLKYYYYTGDTAFLNMSIETGEYIINQDLTPSYYFCYPKFPYAVGSLGNIYPDGSGHPHSNSIYNMSGHIQPDKGAMVGLSLLELYKVTDSIKYLRFAINIANCLVKNAVIGNETNSPWPMRVMANNGELVDGKFSSNVSYACRLFDELTRLGFDTSGSYKATRDVVWNWLKTFVISYEDGSKWNNFFEDHSGDENNPTQINALETVRYLVEKKNLADPDWFRLAGIIINQVRNRWSLTKLDTDGYECVAEQDSDKSPYNSHTARFGSILAIYYNSGGSFEYKDIAYHSLCYGLYSVEDNGFTCTYYDSSMGAWTSDSFGDFFGHYIDAFAAVPEWAGNNNHILKSSSTIRWVSYKDEKLSYKTYDFTGTDILKLTVEPVSILVNGIPISDYNWDKKTNVLIINRLYGSTVTVILPSVSANYLNTNQSKKVNYFPNPMKESLNIIFGNKFNNASISIYNLNGTLCIFKEFKDMKNSISTKNLSQGIYIASITIDSISLFQKLIKI